jgi:hypothetical protein
MRGGHSSGLQPDTGAERVHEQVNNSPAILQQLVFMKKLSVYQKDFINPFHLPYHARRLITIKTPYPVFLFVRISEAEIERSQTLLPEKSKAISVRKDGFFRQMS